MLKNAKHEHFAGQVAKGVTGAEAAVIAGFSQRRAIVTASELLARPEVKARIAELNVIIAERVTEKTGVDKAWVMEKLVEVVRLGMKSKTLQNAAGEVVGDGSPENLAAANKALELIGKEFAMFVDRAEVRTGPLDAMEHDDLKALSFAIAEVKAQAVITDSSSSTRH